MAGKRFHLAPGRLSPFHAVTFGVAGLALVKLPDYRSPRSTSRWVGASAFDDPCAALENTCGSGVLHEWANNPAVPETALQAARSRIGMLLALS